MVAAKPDCTGQRFGRLTVIGRGQVIVHQNGGRHRSWLLRCDCGEEIELVRGDFDRAKGGQKSCGCLGRDRKMVDNNRRPKDISGQRFGLLVAERLTGKKDSSGKPTWLLRCDCGKYRELSLSKLGQGYRLNCGDFSHQPGLHYPPMPNPTPIPVDRLVVKYLKYTQTSACRYDAAEQDERFNRLLRAAWIVFYRRSQGEKISERHERRLILKHLRFAKAIARLKRFVESGGVSRYTFTRYKNDIGSVMADITSSNEAVGQPETQPGKCMSKRRSFKRC